MKGGFQSVVSGHDRVAGGLDSSDGDLSATMAPIRNRGLSTGSPIGSYLFLLFAVVQAQGQQCSILPYPQVHFVKGSGRRGVVDERFDRIGERSRVVIETEDHVVAGLVAHGFGIALVPYMKMLLRRDVKRLQIAQPVWARNFYRVSDDRTYRSPAVRQFRQFVLDGTSL